MIENTNVKNKSSVADVQTGPVFSGHILVAEDVKTNQMVTKCILNRLGLEVTIAEDGSEAIQKVLTEDYDIIIMDMNMPNIDGYEAARYLRKAGFKTPIVALTGDTNKKDIQKCHEAGCDDFLPKPLDSDTLMNIIAKYLPANDTCSKIADSESSQEIQETNPAEKLKLHTTVERQKYDEIINYDRLLNIMGDEESIKEIIPVYIADKKQYYIWLTEAIDSGDTDAVRANAHAIKGAGRNLGADRMMKIAEQLENAGRENNIQLAITIFEQLKNEYEKVMEFLSQPDWLEILKQSRE